MEEYDPAWQATLQIRFKVVAPHLVLMFFKIRFDDALLFAPQGHATTMFANYMPSTSDWKQYFKGVAGPGSPVQWLGAALDTVEFSGGNFIHVDAAPLPVDPAPAVAWSSSVTYKQNLRSVDWPRYVEPYYCTINTNTNMVMQMMFDRSHSSVDEIRFTQFKVKATNVQNSPAQDWQYTVNHVVSGQEYGFVAGFSLRPRLSTGSLEGECANEYSEFVATL
jgi:hypothetical protein